LLFLLRQIITAGSEAAEDPEIRAKQQSVFIAAGRPQQREKIHAGAE
jgi:hypothetical protein